MPRPAEGPIRPTGTTCAWVRERIDPLLDGELAASEEARLQDHLGGCPSCRSELALARSLQGALRDGLPQLACPPEVTARVLAIARREEAEGARRQAADRPPAARRSGGLGGWLAGWLGGGLLRPALAAVALAVLLAAPFVYRDLVRSGGPGVPEVATLPPGPAAPAPVTDGRTAPEPGFSPAEVAAARAQARLVFAYVAAVGRDAGRAVEDDVFAQGIVLPARHAVETLGAAPISASRRKP